MTTKQIRHGDEMYTVPAHTSRMEIILAVRRLLGDPKRHLLSILARPAECAQLVADYRNATAEEAIVAVSQ